jgi:hypothetical protein
MSASEEEIVELGPPREIALVPPPLTVAPPVKAEELVERLNVIKEAAEKAMLEDVDYGKIPGTTKPTLLKPGAEKLAVLFQFDCQTTHDERWEPGDHLTVTAHTIVFHAPSGARLGSGEGLCSTREKKYAYRMAERTCPACGKANIRVSKQGDGFYCWVKTGGCGGNFRADDKRIVDQPTGQVANPDLPDTWNTVVKMARKRSLVDAILVTTGASAIFSQDMEEELVEGPTEPAVPTSAPPQSTPPPATRPGDPRPIGVATLNFLRRLFAETGWTPEELQLQLTAAGAPNVSDIRQAMRDLTEPQVEELVSAMNAAVDKRIVEPSEDPWDEKL